MESLPPNHIRLLHIGAGFGDTPICCNLVVKSLHASPPYEALSYTWGSLDLDSTIICNGVPLLITRHLYEALQYLRKPEHDRIMWIDAVCIDQKNLRERAEQVGLMKDIYAKAFHVVIWLGRETTEDKTAFSVLDRFKTLFETRGYGDLGPDCFVDAGLPDTNDPDWEPLVKLFQRPWFQRIWVVQEATVSRHHFGWEPPPPPNKSLTSMSTKYSTVRASE